MFQVFPLDIMGPEPIYQFYVYSFHDEASDSDSKFYGKPLCFLLSLLYCENSVKNPHLLLIYRLYDDILNFMIKLNYLNAIAL